MFEMQRERLKSQKKEIVKRIEELGKEKEALSRRLSFLETDEKSLDDLEEATSKNKTSTGDQSYSLPEDAFEGIGKDFIEKANDWIRQHEENFHPECYFKTKDFLKNKALYLLPSYTVSIDWTHLGRLISVECDTCKKYSSQDERIKGTESYMFLEEA